MNTIVKYVVGHTYRPWLEKYLSKKRIYRHNGFTLEIPPEVFHPGFFFSTRLLMNQVDQFSLAGKTFLELGAGSGLISLHAAKKGAKVTATDLNRTAVDYLRINSRANGIGMEIIHSDLFCDLPLKQFDFIIINPPYYKRDAITEKDLAWCCGSKGEYFGKLFEGIGNYVHAQSEILMVLCDGCDLQMIVDMAHEKGFLLDCINTKRNVLETNFIFRIQKKSSQVSSDYLFGEFGSNQFVEQYLALRTKEDRVYTDQQLLELPYISPDHPHAQEWAVREASAIELSVYLRLTRARHILEIGCGNGWLANKIARIPGTIVTAIDVNRIELEQGARVFRQTPNLRFLAGDLADGILQGEKFNVILFAASIQYFENLDKIMDLAFEHLTAGGQVHIIDSFLYKESEIKAARERTKRYFEDKGFPLMTKYYFHHSLNSVRKYKHKFFYDPKGTTSMVIPNYRVFPWIMVQPNQ